MESFRVFAQKVLALIEKIKLPGGVVPANLSGNTRKRILLAGGVLGFS